LMINNHSRSRGICARVGFKGQLPSSVGLRCSSDASENPLGVILDKAVFQQRLRFRIYRRVDPQSQTAQGLIDGHKLSFSSGVGENQLLDGRGAMAWNEAWPLCPRIVHTVSMVCESDSPLRGMAVMFRVQEQTALSLRFLFLNQTGKRFG
jgi:hypothetical protein